MMLDLDGLTHRYETETVVEDVSFGLDAGELLAVLGPSGCGKTTIVRAITGHVDPTGGRVRLRGRDVTDEPPESRDIGVVFQEPTLFPHLTVAENVAYGLEARSVGAERRAETVARYLGLVSLESRRDAYPSELSGGEKRRIELARALAPEPDLLVLDEPLSGLDRALRERLRAEIARIQRTVGVTTLYVTHDQEEAMALADRLLVLTGGRVAAIGRPRALYESPPTPFVASFLGWSNRLTVTRANDGPGLDLRDVTTNGDATPSEGETLACFVRPEDLAIGRPGSRPSDLSLPGVVTHVADLGKRYEVTVELDAGDVLTIERRSDPPAEGERVVAGIDPADAAVFEDADGSQVP